MTNPQVQTQTPNIVNTYVVDTEGVHFTYREIDLGVLYSFTPSATTCDIFKAFADVFEDLEQIWFESDLVIDYSPDYVYVEGGINTKLAKAIAIVLDELKEGKQLSDTITTIRFFIEFDVDEAYQVLKSIKNVTRLFDGYGYCYMIQLREE
ncbi:MAG: hypothetical protein QXX12_06540 [Nanopusillaceae archaeon]